MIPVERRNLRSRVSVLLVSALLLITVLVVAGCGSHSSKRTSDASRQPSPAEVRKFTFHSAILDRDMPIKVFLPAGYTSSDRRYPVLYMLHGLDPYITENWEWEDFGIFWQAETRMSNGELPPFIIALPQGEQGYWIDQYGGPSWSKYVAQDVVTAIDTGYRTITAPGSRAIGGLSMGADGALQIAMSNPGVFGIVGMHSPALRPMEYAAAYYGDFYHFNAYYPPSQEQSDPEAARRLKIELDAGDSDDWLPNTEWFHAELESLEIPHTYNRWPGRHDGYYWGFHIPDYFKFYAQAFGRE